MNLEKVVKEAIKEVVGQEDDEEYVADINHNVIDRDLRNIVKELEELHGYLADADSTASSVWLLADKLGIDVGSEEAEIGKWIKDAMQDLKRNLKNTFKQNVDSLYDDIKDTIGTENINDIWPERFKW